MLSCDCTLALETDFPSPLFARHDHLVGGANRDRTDDLKLAKLALSQLSYGPMLAINR